MAYGGTCVVLRPVCSYALFCTDPAYSTIAYGATLRPRMVLHSASVGCIDLTYCTRTTTAEGGGCTIRYLSTGCLIAPYPISVPDLP
eukprot:477865-Rhodomonas_salina.2